DRNAVERGSIVVACLSETWSRFALQRGILGPGTCPGGSYPLGKMVIAVEGDVITVSPERLLIGNAPLANSASLRRDRYGEPMPQYPDGRYNLRAGEVWLYSCHAAAFDSRY